MAKKRKPGSRKLILPTGINVRSADSGAKKPKRPPKDYRV